MMQQTDWEQEDTEAAASGSDATKHLWEESWDDDDTSDDFSAQLKYVPAIAYLPQSSPSVPSRTQRAERY
jgi:hypothetical protein